MAVYIKRLECEKEFPEEYPASRVSSIFLDQSDLGRSKRLCSQGTKEKSFDQFS